MNLGHNLVKFLFRFYLLVESCLEVVSDFEDYTGLVQRVVPGGLFPNHIVPSLEEHFPELGLMHEVFCPFSAEYTANQAAGFTMKSAAFCGFPLGQGSP